VSAGPESLRGELGPLEAHRWAALQDGAVVFQRCREDGHAWLPPAPECPRCLGTSWEWEEAGGEGVLVSWVVFHRALAPALGDRVPYAVALVELAEGPRLVTELEGVPGPARPRCDAPVRVAAAARDGVRLARAALA
jgi:uncharacterized OB-fold protein